MLGKKMDGYLLPHIHLRENHQIKSYKAIYNHTHERTPFFSGKAGSTHNNLDNQNSAFDALPELSQLTQPFDL